jgi:sulfane dehydrogenase subunit SoxC
MKMKITKLSTHKDQSLTENLLDEPIFSSNSHKFPENPKRELDRRKFMQTSLLALASSPAMVMADESIKNDFPAWSTTPGKGLNEYGQPSKFEATTKRGIAKAYGDLAPGTGSARTPIEKLEGIITPSGLHFDRSHNGTPDIDPTKHQLSIHGLVDRPLNFSIENLLRYPMISRTYFVECAGNSAVNIIAPKPVQATAGTLHGLISCSDWTGIPLSVLLREAGVNPSGKWVLAEGADAPGMSRSFPIEKAMDNALIALYQNGEKIRPEQGYPMRLLLPGWEGNMNVKWLRSLKITAEPTHTKDETSKYTDPLPNGKARQFTFELGVKSIITKPSGLMKLPSKGFYEISGIAWSGAGKVARVEISTNGGKDWFDAMIDGPNHAFSLVRFRAPWNWNGEPAFLQSRAIDERGNIQPTRAAYKANNAVDGRYHNNTIVTWAVQADGSVQNAYL